jgi:hypothetical protein
MPEPVTAFNSGQLPQQPDIIPDELRKLSADNTTSDWTTRVPPAGVGMFIAAVVRWLSHPRFGVKVTVDTEPTGWTIRVDLPTRDTREDVTIGDINQ